VKLVRVIVRFLFTSIAMARLGSYAARPTVNGFTIFSRNTHLGHDTHFNGMRVRGSGRVTIGSHFHSGQGCLIISAFHDYRRANKLPYGNLNVDKEVHIQENVWIGDRVIILGGVKIGEGAIIQAGSVVSRDIAPLAIAGGNPALSFKTRDSAHYYRLKEEQIKRG
jgi:acetyltransferase-like isoleucine patch superfamily enzyme